MWKPSVIYQGRWDSGATVSHAHPLQVGRVGTVPSCLLNNKGSLRFSTFLPH